MTTQTIDIRAHRPRAGFRSICPQCESLREAIERLHRDGHLGNRKCAITSGFAPLVRKGKSSRVMVGTPPHGQSLDAVRHEIEPANPHRAWLEVPAGMEEDARAIVSALHG